MNARDVVAVADDQKVAAAARLRPAPSVQNPRQPAKPDCHGFFRPHFIDFGGATKEWFGGNEGEAFRRPSFNGDSAMNSSTSESGHSGHCITSMQLREAVDALREAAKRRYALRNSKGKHGAINYMVAKSYEQTARALDDIVQILERDQTVLQPLAPDPAITTSSETAGEKPTCPECGSDAVRVDAVARWSVDIQDWVVSDVFDADASCDDCEGVDLEMLWVDVERKQG